MKIIWTSLIPLLGIDELVVHVFRWVKILMRKFYVLALIPMHSSIVIFATWYYNYVCMWLTHQLHVYELIFFMKIVCWLWIFAFSSMSMLVVNCDLICSWFLTPFLCVCLIYFHLFYDSLRHGALHDIFVALLYDVQQAINGSLISFSFF